MGFEYLQGLL